MSSDDALDVRRVTGPFSTTDIFQYLIPGATFFITIFFFEQRLLLRSTDANLSGVSTPFSKLLEVLGLQMVDQPSITYSIAVLFILLILGYVAGHVFASAASLFIDRLMVRLGHGYPYQYILGRRGSKHGPADIREATYRGAFFWINATALSLYLWRAIDYFYSDDRAWWIWYAAWASMSICALLFLLKNVVHHLKAIAEGRRLPRFKKTASRLIARARKFQSAYMYLASGPYDVLTGAFATYHRTARLPLRGDLLKHYQEAFKKEFSLDSKTVNSLNFWYSYMYVIRNAPGFHRIALGWLQQYEFARNMSTSFYFAAVYSGFILCRSIWFMHGNGESQHWVDLMTLLLPLAVFIAAFVMLSRYYYLYTCYFNRFIFRAFVYLHLEKGHNKKTGA